ncbi:MAG: MarR family transcriptional regulator [Proteobacteria bacterium]|nr:MarR family transcriptional regulator [Pseudomonadota bacterium]HQR04592.1 MarR family transcriptional regulator [Rhodocyclaceae bacterium]
MSTASPSAPTSDEEGTPINVREALRGLLTHADATVGILVFLLHRLARSHAILLSRVMPEFGDTEMLVLGGLLISGPPHRLSPTSLAESVLQTPGGMTKTLQRLEDQGLVHRVRDSSDRRALLVELTPAGHKTARDCLETIIGTHTRMLAGMDHDEVEQLVRMLRKLLNLVEPAIDVKASGDTMF